MDDAERKRILDEAKSNLRDRDQWRDRPALPPDALSKWKADADRFARDVEQADHERKASEQRRTQEREAQMRASSAEEWDRWFLSRLQNHWMQLAAPTIQGIATSMRETLDEIRAMYEAREKIMEQKHEIAIIELEKKIAILSQRLAELKTDLVVGTVTAQSLRAVN
jgi:hypothetical protein